MANELLKKLGDSLKGSIQNQLQAVGTDSRNEQSLPYSSSILCYLRSILQTVHINPHTRNTSSLGPAYRYFCEVAESFLSLLEAEKSRMDKFVSAFQPAAGWRALSGLQNDMEKLFKVWKECNDLCEQAAFYLLDLVDECLEQLHRSMGQESPALPPDRQSKVIVFLFARVTSLVTMTMRFQNAFKNQMMDASGSSEDYKEGRKKLIASFLQRLVKASHISLVSQASLEANEFSGGRAALLDMAVTLRPKAEQYLTKILGDLDSKNTNTVSLGLECFIELPSSNETDVMQDTSLAKLCLMKYVMKKLCESEPTIFPETKTMINFYETLLFVDVPRCSHFFFQTPTRGHNLQNQARAILSDLVCVLENASHMLCQPERSNGRDINNRQKVLIQQHHLLIRWLAPTSANIIQSTPTTSKTTQ
jgi:hypothetical protein